MAKKLTLNQVADLMMALPEVDTTTRNVIDVSQHSRSVTLTIGQLFGLVLDKKLKRNLLQRNDKLRREMGRAKHVTLALHAAHLDIVVAYYEGAFHLIDGCHRVGHWVETLGAQIPSHVTVILKMPQSEEEYFSLYRAYDSPKAGKSMRDFVYGYMRHIGMESKLKSKLTLTGSFATAFKNLCKGSPGRTELATMRMYKDAVLCVDKHKLVPEQVPQGVIQAAILLYHTMESTAPVKEYINEIVTAFDRGRATLSAPTLRVLKDFDKVRGDHGDSIGGETVTRELAEVFETGFDRFCTAKTGVAASAFQRTLRTMAPASTYKLY